MSGDAPPAQAVAYIDVQALQHNLSQVRHYAPHAKVLAVIKANAYGHGLAAVARALAVADAFAVGTIYEANELRAIAARQDIVVLQGVNDGAELALALANNLQLVIHSTRQLELLERATVDKPIKCWLKVDTGMHRLGITPDELTSVLARMRLSANIAEPVIIMSHLACADEPERAENQAQIQCFDELPVTAPCLRSLANSAAVVAFPAVHYDWVRPGIMLYGVSPLAGRTAQETGLKPVMTLKSRLIAVRQAARGDAIGYGATWRCPVDMPIGVVGLGYGDGYPRHAPAGTPVLIDGRRVPIIGHISMDLITLDLRELPTAQVGDEVILWGDGLPIEVIADAAGSIAYELACRLTPRVEYRTV